MDISKKLKILSDAAKYDASCSSSGSNRQNIPGGIGNAQDSGICHSWSDDGRCISLLKILMTNVCIYDCVYCINRTSNDIPRACFTVDEVVDLTINFYKRNYIEGLFLSSGIIKSPDYTMEMLISVVKKLRTIEKYNGYIHLKLIPGASDKLIHQAGLYADRVSVNIELPSDKSLRLLTNKTKSDIITPMNDIGNSIIQNRDERKRFRNAPVFSPAGQSTQLIVGASPENDLHIINLTGNLYKKFALKRVYYSAFIPTSNDNRLPTLSTPPLKREHRLYQADWLMRYYKFEADEILESSNPFLDEAVDPKAGWALRHINLFPVEINSADYEILLRVPGIGVRSALRIVKGRKKAFLGFDNLKKIGVVLKRAKYFITCKGKMMERFELDEMMIREAMKSGNNQKKKVRFEQLKFFNS